MVLELHVWGPAFGLPSLDAQCLAAIAYLSQALPSGEWVLVPSSDPFVSPTNELPALRNRSTWISKYRNIVDYLRQYSAGQWDLDEELGPKEKAELTAFSSFIESQGSPILDLSLYVSSENYTNVTRAAYAEILQWPSQWITPPSIRAVARSRSDHLGLSSLDVDTEASEENPSGSERVSKGLISRPRETVSSLLGKLSHKNQFRLDALTSDFYDPLEKLLGEKKYCLSRESPSSLDCLVTGYLSLMLFPDLPLKWTRDSMQTKYPNLARYTRRMVEAAYGGPVHGYSADQKIDDGTDGGKEERASKLPWQAPSRPSFSAIGNLMFTSILDAIPVISQLRSNRQLQKAAIDPSLDDYDRRQLKAIADAQTRETYSQVAAVGTGLGLFMTYLFYEGIIQWPGKTAKSSTENDQKDFGEAGAMLGL